jgi:hypothetical protein
VIVRKLALTFLFAAILAGSFHGAALAQEALQARQVALIDLGAEPFAVLQGPVDQIALDFQLPSHWQLFGESSLTLNLQNFFSSFVPAQGEIAQENLIAGHISLLLDGELIHRSVLSQNGLQDLSIPLSPENFDQSGENHQLTIRWDAGASCNLNLSSTVLLQPESAFTFSYAEGNFAGDLSRLPAPFFSEHPIEDIGTLIVLPSAPNEQQVAAGIAAAASLGRYAPDSAITITTENLLSNDLRSANQLIFVGALGTFSSLDRITLPHLNNDRLQLPPSSRPEVGFVEIAPSPWNLGRGLLVISGTSDAAVLQAAEQSGNPNLVMNSDGDLAMIEIDTVTSPLVDTIAATFSELGQSDNTFANFGNSQLRIPFYVSPEKLVSEQAFLDLRFAHSRLVDYLRSSLTVTINGNALSSVRLTDQSAARHSELILLPSALLRPGLNYLEISAEILPLDICAGENESEYWLTVYADSNLNLPSAEDQTPLQAKGSTFDQFPMPFLGEQMQHTTLLLPATNTAAWTNAAELMRGLAANYEIWPLQPQVRFSNTATLASLESNSLIVLGDFDEFLGNPVIEAALFMDQTSAGNGQITLSSGASIAYEPGVPVSVLAVGQLETPNSPALAILGNSPAGVSEAIELLTAPGFEPRNQTARLLVIQGERLITDAGELGTGAAEEVADETPEDTAPVRISNGKGAWLPVLLLLLIVGLGLLIYVEVTAWIKKRR